jgi:tetratricopeptide (TPR) repeat protein
MAYVAFAMVTLYIAGVLGAIVFGLVGSSTPRTAVERQLQELESTTRGGDKSPETWARYIDTLVYAGRITEAKRAIANAKKVVDQSDGAEITLAEARMYFAQKDYKKAIATADAAAAIIDKKYQVQSKSTKLPNKAVSFGINPNFWEARLLRANAYEALGDDANALKDYNDFLKNDATASDVLILRAKLKLRMNDPKGAAADFKAALVYDPTNQEALDGLKKIGAN